MEVENTRVEDVRMDVMRTRMEEAKLVTEGIQAEKCDELSRAFGSTKRLDLTFSDVSYSVRAKLFSRERKELLSSVSGEFLAGELTAIMGPSGAGKTTLMDILAGYTTASVTGDFKVNSEPRNPSAFRRSRAYIMQDDNLHALLTIREAMHIAAQLKLSASASRKKRSIMAILKGLDLYDIRKMRTGDLSSGQRKRLSIALELVSNPPIMFFDEPTSCLDSVSARQCIELLKSLARAGRTIVCTIHQPSATIVEAIDHLYVLGNGRCCYTGSPRKLLDYLRGHGLHCPTYSDPTDFLLEILIGDYGDHQSELVDSSENGRSVKWRDTPNLTASTEQNSKRGQSTLSASKDDIKDLHTYASGSLKQIRLLLWRNLLRVYRDRAVTMSILIAHPLMGILVSMIFWKIGEDASTASDNVKLLFFNVLFLSYCAFSSTNTTFPIEMPIMKREYFNRWYRPHAVYVAQLVTATVVEVLATLSYTFIVYYASGQDQDTHRVILYMSNTVLLSLVNQVIGVFFGISLKLQIAVIIGPYSLIPFMVFSGFFVHMSHAHRYLHWLFNISIYKYAYEAVIDATYGYNRPYNTKCSDDYCHYASPKILLDALDMNNADYWHSTYVLGGLCITLHLLAYLLLSWKLKTR